MNMKKPNVPTKDLIIGLLAEKASMKQDVYHNIIRVFDQFKVVLKIIQEELKQEIQKIDPRIIVELKERSDFQVELKVAGDELVFVMHTNVFTFDKDHPMWRTSYVQKNETNAFCGMINIYNFLADSFKYDRKNDLGYLIGRVFVNRDGHFFVEGKRQLGFLYNSYDSDAIDNDKIKSIIHSAILYSLGFDLFTPPYDQVKLISVEEILSSNMNEALTTGKRLGFKFQADTDHSDHLI
jgi:uncharacterized protein YacL (UPF0231 family)